MDLLKRLWKEEEGQGLVEYGLILLLMVVIAVAVVGIFGDEIQGIYERIRDNIQGAPNLESGA
ncbi:Flp family type IVb pilin [Proteiniclasticum ruminis]|uniref:Pilus assembly protein Flp/PilA n=1 Tax=Proteiniclasticum ruminis TaxID=398199 RepID=A0A1I5D6L8_9CLOT|nr:hypothetical protein [Proteiniclasticum ruminis]SFN94850.1 pilus assembly protein Flp/PilA [Proteiniclasticum ruminis]